MNEAIDNTLIPDLEQRIPELMKGASVPGLSIGLIQNAQVVWSHGFGISIGGEHPAFRFLENFQSYLA